MSRATSAPPGLAAHSQLQGIAESGEAVITAVLFRQLTITHNFMTGALRVRMQSDWR